MSNLTKKSLLAAGIIAAEVQSLDPHKIEGVPGNNITRDLMEGLANIIARTVLLFLVWQKAGITKTLKYGCSICVKDAKWSNGKPVTAQDFVYSWQRLVNPKTASPYASYLQYAHVENVDAIIAVRKINRPWGCRPSTITPSRSP